MRNDDYVFIHCDYIAHTKDAVLVAQNNENYWIPRSVLAFRSDRLVENVSKHDRVNIEVRQWFAEQKGIEYD